MDLHEIFKDKLFAAVIATGAVGFQLLVLAHISKAYPTAMLAKLLIIFMTFLLLSRWVGKSPKIGTLGAVIATAMVELYQCTVGYAQQYGELVLLAVGMLLMNWLMVRGVKEQPAEYSDEESSWLLFLISGILGGAYTFVPFVWLRDGGWSMGASPLTLKYLGILFLIVMVGLFIREFKKKILNSRVPSEALARFFRVMSTTIVIVCVAACIVLGYKFLYMYGQNHAVGQPGWQDVFYENSSELFMLLGLLATSTALSIGLVAFNTAEAVTASVLAAGAWLLLQTVTGNMVLTVQQFLINAIIFCLAALMVLESKGETVWE